MAKLSVWSPQLGPQTEAVTATWCDELFFGGARGGGKSDFLLGDFLQDVQRLAKNWQGILFRRTYPELQELISRSKRLYWQTRATWHEQDKEWRWPNGAVLRMRYLERADDATRYQGHQYTWIGWDELTQWASAEAYNTLKACLRWAETDVPTKRIRASGNPGGPGHQWVKSYFIDHAPLGYEPYLDPDTGMERMFIPSRVQDNKILLDRDPNYINRLRGVGSPELVRAWLEGDWSVVTGAFFPEFSPRHIIEPFEIPEHWLRFVSYDHGFARPFSVGWWAVSDGTLDYPKGALIRYREWYGKKGPNVGAGLKVWEIANGILEREGKEKITYRKADPSIFKQEGGPSIAELFQQNGIVFLRADNARLAGWAQMRDRFLGEDGHPMVYVFKTCTDSIRTIPALQHDDKKPEDLDTDGEDHAADDWRYGHMSRPWTRVAKDPQPMKTMHGMTFEDLLKAEQKFKHRHY